MVSRCIMAFLSFTLCAVFVFLTFAIVFYSRTMLPTYNVTSALQHLLFLYGFITFVVSVCCAFSGFAIVVKLFMKDVFNK